jgi:ssDNA-binding Zn-finger/Zn-ribbon topoisomerase 1
VKPRDCPDCLSGKLVRKLNGKTGHPFLACDRWPDCDHTEEITAYDAMLGAGAPTLPGLEDA